MTRVVAYRSVLLCAALAGCAPRPCAAHDFWLQPAAYSAPLPVRMPFTLQVGHGAARQRSPIAARRIVRAAAIAPDGAAHDLRDALHAGAADDDGSATLASPGTWVLVLATDDRAQIHLPALRFNEYLAAEGLAPALAQRSRARRTLANGSENYGRRSKALVQVGDGCEETVTPATAATGLTLEIVLDKAPCALRPGDALPVHVVYFGEPLAGALLKLTDLSADAEPLSLRRTDAHGSAAFDVPAAGAWLLNVVWTRPLPEGSATDFETTFSSVSFAVRAR